MLRKTDKNALTKEQHVKIKQLMDDEANMLNTLSRDRSVPKDKKAEQCRLIRENTQGKIKALLTPEQLRNYEEQEKKKVEFREKLRQGKIQKKQQNQQSQPLRQEATQNKSL
jgi:hypothetical protein